MSDAEFWELTQEEFEARYDRWMEQEKRWDLRFGVVASGYVNTKLKEGCAPIEPGRWFGYDQQTADEQEMTVEESVAFARALADQMNAVGRPS